MQSTSSGKVILAAAAALAASLTTAASFSTAAALFSRPLLTTSASRSLFVGASPQAPASPIVRTIIDSKTSNMVVNENSNNSPSSLGLFGSLGSLFSTRAGAAGIDYPNLVFPANEMGEAALAGEVPSASKVKPELEIATVAGGCFWGLELAFQRTPGVEYTAVGYTQGRDSQPSYDAVCSGGTGHTEAVQVLYDPKVVSYDKLLDVFFGKTDPTTVNGQGNDYGSQYRTGVYTHSKEQMEAAKGRFEVEKGKTIKAIATELKDATVFWPAEQYHQQYLSNPNGRNPQNPAKGATETIRCYG